MAKVFRLFISSTFQDWQPEREYLRNYVFPRLRTLCEKRGARFLPIDLRWGISEEACKTHEAVATCLEEIERCQRLTPRPNFLILAGDRNGWRPIPQAISGEHWKKMEKLGAISENDRFHHWYVKDENAVPAAYVLKPKEAEWQQVEHELRQRLDKSYLANTAVWGDEFSEDELAFLVGSVTEQEIVIGALKVKDADHHIHFFDRRFRNNVAHPAFTDQVDSFPRQRQDSLKERLINKLKDNYHPMKPDFDDFWTAGERPKAYLKTFGNEVFQSLCSIIEKELDQEGQEPEYLPEGPCVGRDKEFEELLQKDSAPKLVYGQPGSGKSTLLAETARRMDDNNAPWLAFWIGRNPRCASGTGLLKAVLDDLRSRGYVDAGFYWGGDYSLKSFSKLAILLRDALANLKTSKRRPRIIVDALDQLPADDPARNLMWVDKNSGTILSTLDEGLARRFGERFGEGSVMRLEGLGRDSAEAALNGWLNKAERTLTEVQRKQLLDAFEASGMPLHLRLLFEEACHWQSFDALPEAIPTSADEAICSLYQRLAGRSEHGEAMVQRTLGYLCTTPQGVPEDVLLALLRKDPCVFNAFRERSPNSPEVDELPEIVWSRLYHDLERYLTRHFIYSKQYLDFYHAEFRRVILASERRRDSVRGLSQTRWIVDDLAEDWSDCHGEGKSGTGRSLCQFLFQHGADNAIELGGKAVKRAARRLCNFTYLEARIRSLPDEHDALIEEYDRLFPHYLQTEDTNGDFKVWADFIRGRGALLLRAARDGKMFEALRQLAWEHGEDSPVSAEADSYNKAVPDRLLRRGERPAHFLPLPKVVEKECGFETKDIKYHTESGLIMVKGRAEDERCCYQWTEGSLQKVSADACGDTLPRKKAEAENQNQNEAHGVGFFRQLQMENETYDRQFEKRTLRLGKELTLQWQTEHPREMENYPLYQYRSWLWVKYSDEGVELSHSHAGILHIESLDDGHVLSWGSKSSNVAIYNLKGSGPLSDLKINVAVPLTKGRVLLYSGGSGFWVNELASGKTTRLKKIPDTDRCAAIETGKCLLISSGAELYAFDRETLAIKSSHRYPGVIGGLHEGDQGLIVWGNHDVSNDEHESDPSRLFVCQGKSREPVYDGFGDGVIPVDRDRVVIYSNDKRLIDVPRIHNLTNGEVVDIKTGDDKIHLWDALSLDDERMLLWGDMGLYLIDAQSGELVKTISQLPGRKLSLGDHGDCLHEILMCTQGTLWLLLIEDQSTPGEDIYVSHTYRWNPLREDEPEFVGQDIGMPHCRMDDLYVWVKPNERGLGFRFVGEGEAVEDAPLVPYFGENIEALCTLDMKGQENRLLIRQGAAIHELVFSDRSLGQNLNQAGQIESGGPENGGGGLT